MPLVEVFYRGNRQVPMFLLLDLQRALPEIIASALNVEEREKARLTKNDIEVRFREAGPLDVIRFDIEISVLGSFFPERYESLQKKRISQIKHDLDTIIDGRLSYFVFVVLGMAGFVDVKAAAKHSESYFRKGDIVRLARLTDGHVKWGWEKNRGVSGIISTGSRLQSNTEEHVLDGKHVKGVSFCVNFYIDGKMKHFNPVFEEELDMENSPRIRKLLANL